MYDKTNDPIIILDRMLELTKRERLYQGAYSAYMGDTEPDAPCGGNQFCAIGSMWFAAGEYVKMGKLVSLTCVTDGERGFVLDHNAGLLTAYNALAEAANDWYQEKHGTPVPKAGDKPGFPYFDHDAERLFEARVMGDDDEYKSVITDGDFADIVQRAKELVLA